MKKLFALTFALLLLLSAHASYGVDQLETGNVYLTDAKTETINQNFVELSGKIPSAIALNGTDIVITLDDGSTVTGSLAELATVSQSVTITYTWDVDTAYITANDITEVRVYQDEDATPVATSDPSTGTVTFSATITGCSDFYSTYANDLNESEYSSPAVEWCVN